MSLDNRTCHPCLFFSVVCFSLTVIVSGPDITQAQEEPPTVVCGSPLTKREVNSDSGFGAGKERTFRAAMKRAIENAIIANLHSQYVCGMCKACPPLINKAYQCLKSTKTEKGQQPGDTEPLVDIADAHIEDPRRHCHRIPNTSNWECGTQSNPAPVVFYEDETRAKPSAEVGCHPCLTDELS